MRGDNRNGMKQRINLLPVPTWNHLGVNWAEVREIPAVRPKSPMGSGHQKIAPLPDGVTRGEDEGWKGRETVSGMGNEFDRHLITAAGTACRLKAEGQVKGLVRIDSLLTEEAPVFAGNYEICAEEGAAVTVLMTADSDEKAEGQLTELVRIHGKKNSFVRLIQIQTLNERSESRQAASACLEEGARVELIRAVLGGKTAYCGSRAMLEGKESAYCLNTIYFGDGDQHLDLNDVAEHMGRDTASEIHAAGVLAGESRKILRGTIDFKRGAVHGRGHESEEVLLLGSRIRNQTVPLILCGEENVEGSHGATVGRLDESQLYYLCSRGLTLSQARKLVVEGRFAPVFAAIPDEAVREKLAAHIERRLERNDTELKDGRD